MRTGDLEQCNYSSSQKKIESLKIAHKKWHQKPATYTFHTHSFDLQATQKYNKKNQPFFAPTDNNTPKQTQLLQNN